MSGSLFRIGKAHFAASIITFCYIKKTRYIKIQEMQNLWFVFVIIKTNNRLLSTHFKEKDFFSVTSSFIIY